MPSRKIEDLIPEAQEAILRFEQALRDRGLYFFKRCCTYRSQEEQNALWLRGRRSLADVNKAYMAAGLAPIGLQENKRPVTWTTISAHTGREAVDYYIEKNGRYISDVKADVNDNDIPDWEEFGKTAVECGLEWGRSWRRPDRPHVQLKR